MIGRKNEPALLLVIDVVGHSPESSLKHSVTSSQNRYTFSIKILGVSTENRLHKFTQ